MSETELVRTGWKRKVVHELSEYWINFGYLAFFLIAFGWYRRLILAEYQLHHTNYWFPVIEAAILAKVIMLGDFLRVGRGLEQRPLILSALFRTFMFSVWVGIFGWLEATVRGLLEHRGLMSGFEEIANRGRDELLARCVVMLVAFVPFFSFRELERVLGPEQLRALFWRRRTVADRNLDER